VPAGPDLSASERTHFFARMRRTAEQARSEDQFLLRRQALYLSGYDDQPDTTEWLAHQQAAERPGDWLTRWAKWWGTILLDAKRPKEVVAALREARTALNNGELVGLFPEGGISRTGQIMSFKPGLMKILEGTDEVKLTELDDEQLMRLVAIDIRSALAEG
jgi:hypothetical protein